MKYNIAGIAVIIFGILGIMSMAIVATSIIKAYGLPFVTTEMVVIQQPAIQTGQQSVIECIGGDVHIDGVNRGEWVTVNWASPIKADNRGMTKHLYCLWDVHVKVSDN